MSLDIFKNASQNLITIDKSVRLYPLNPPAVEKILILGHHLAPLPVADRVFEKDPVKHVVHQEVEHRQVPVRKAVEGREGAEQVVEEKGRRRKPVDLVPGPPQETHPALQPVKLKAVSKVLAAFSPLLDP